MKQNKIRLLTAGAIASILAMGMATHASAQVLAVDFTDTTDGGATAPGFSSFVGNLGTTGSVTQTFGAFSVSISGQEGFFNRGGGGSVSDANMYSSFIYHNTSSSIIDLSVTGLAANTTYQLTVWGFDSAGASTDVIDPTGGTTGPEGTITSSGATPTSNSDYTTVLDYKTDGSGDLTFQDSGGGIAPTRVNGFEVDAIVVEAPEPSTYALMGLGALALLVVSRRRRTV